MPVLQFVGQPLGKSTNVGSLQFKNLYPHPTLDERIVVYGTPGLRSILNVGDYPVRGSIVFQGDPYVVVFDILYRINGLTGVPTPIGKLITQSGPVSMAQNVSELIMVDGEFGYYYRPGTPIEPAAFARIDSEGFPYGCKTVTFLDGYFVCEVPNTNQYQFSGLYDATAWDPLDFNVAESQPDQIQAVASIFGYLFVFGLNHTELWYNSGDQNSVFSRANGLVQQVGIASFRTIAKVGDTGQALAWLARSPQGQGFVVVNQGGGTAQRISNPEVEYIWNEFGRIDDATAFAYQMSGHAFYVLTFPGANQTWVYDFLTQQWHQRSYKEGRYVADNYMFYNGRHLVGSYLDGAVYEIREDEYTDDGETIVREITTPTSGGDIAPVSFVSCQIDMERGVGLPSGEGDDPKVLMRYSDDGGHTWSNPAEGGIGRIGEYNLRVIWRRLGWAWRRAWRFTITDPVKVVLINLTVKTK